jgi:HlyD family secretion protein
MDQRVSIEELHALARPSRNSFPRPQDDADQAAAEKGNAAAARRPAPASKARGDLLHRLLQRSPGDPVPKNHPRSRRRKEGDAAPVQREQPAQRKQPAQREKQGDPKPDPAKQFGDDAPDVPPKRVSRLVYVVPAVLVVGLVGWGAWTHWSANTRAAEVQQSAEDYKPTLRTAVAKREDGPVSLTLPGTTAPFDSARLYARATGYVAERRVDIGSRVKKGDLLLRIGAPDLNAQLVQAAAQLGQTRAALMQAQANVQSSQSTVDLARVTNGRTSTLAAQGWETRQNADNTRANVQSGAAAVDASKAAVTVAEANVAAQFAAVQRLQALVGYLDVTAPFDGVVTSRSVDVGDLVSADSSGGTALFALQRDDILRIQVAVPQSGAVALRDGLPAKVQVQELPGQDFTGTISRNAVALDPASRSVAVEVDLPNGDGRLRPGLYVTVVISIPRDRPGVVVPDEAVLFNGQGLRVAVVGGDDTVHMQDVTVARDLGTTVELRDGLNGGERVALSPPVDLVDKQKVKVEAPPDDKKSGAPGQAPQPGKGKAST